MTMAFVHDALPGRVRFGVGALAHVGDEVELLGCRRVLLVSRRGAVDAVAAAVQDVLGDRCVGWFDDIRVHVPHDLAAAAADLARATDADAVVCVGGGAAVGTAKMVAVEVDLPIIAVPTTYAGSEMTPIWGTTSGQRKRTGRDRRVLPRTVIYDARLTLSLPPHISGPSGMNALAHAIEALYAPGTTPVVRLFARDAIRALVDGLPRVVADGTDVGARDTTLYGAYLAGASLGAGGASVHHRIAHLLGGMWDLPHALLHAVLLPHSVAFVAPAVGPALQPVADALGVTDVAHGLFELLIALGIDPTLTSAGMPSAAYERAVDVVVEAQPPSPRPIEREPVARLLRGAFDGRPPAG
jgi:maleylacetate reductase